MNCNSMMLFQNNSMRWWWNWPTHTTRWKDGTWHLKHTEPVTCHVQSRREVPEVHVTCSTKALVDRSTKSPKIQLQIAAIDVRKPHPALNQQSAHRRLHGLSKSSPCGFFGSKKYEFKIWDIFTIRFSQKKWLRRGAWTFTNGSFNAFLA